MDTPIQSKDNDIGRRRRFVPLTRTRDMVIRVYHQWKFVPTLANFFRKVHKMLRSAWILARWAAREDRINLKFKAVPVVANLIDV